MSVSLTISRPGHETEFVAMCGQRSAEVWVGEMARKHGFQILDGTYPAWMFEAGDIDQAIHEISILREENARWLELEGRFSEQDKSSNRERWDRLVTRLRQLKDEPDAEAHFG